MFALIQHQQIESLDFTSLGFVSSAVWVDLLSSCILWQRARLVRVAAFLHQRYSEQWPNSNSNGYAYYHRVDRVNGGDENATHTTGMGKKQRFWYH